MKPFAKHVLVLLAILLNDHRSDATAIRNSVSTSSSAVLLNITQRHEQFHPLDGLVDGQHRRSARHNVKQRRIYTADELLHTRFPSQISDDIDMDPCKSGIYLK